MVRGEAPKRREGQQQSSGVIETIHSNRKVSCSRGDGIKINAPLNFRTAASCGEKGTKSK